MGLYNSIRYFDNKKVDPSIINEDQISYIVTYLLDTIENKISGDVVEFGCYVGEAGKFIQKTLTEARSPKQFYVYDSFEGLPELTSYEQNTGWTTGGLKTTQEVLINNYLDNGLRPPIITKGWFKDVPDYRVPDQISFAFLDGDFYNSIFDSLTKVYNKVVDGGYILIHDYNRSDLPGVKAAIDDFAAQNNVIFNIIQVCEQLAVIKKNSETKLLEIPKQRFTVVTGLWDIGRDKLTEGWSRGYDHYLEKFDQLLKADINLIIFGDSKLEQFVRERRKNYNTQFVVRDIEWIKNMPFFDKIQQIRNDPQWFNQAGWLKDSTQAKLELYNPLVMSKMFLLNDAKILDKFNSEYLFWLDAGITNTVHSGYFTHDRVLDKLPDILKDKFLFVSFPYPDGGEIHGFDRKSMNRLAQTDNVEYVCRAGFFGGPSKLIGEVNNNYYQLLKTTLEDNLMGTEESIFTLMTYQYPQLFTRFSIESNGLLSTFFENLKTSTLQNLEALCQEKSGVGLYVIGFNSPKQFEVLCQSYLKQPGFITDTKNFLLDNSTDESTTEEYKRICQLYNFEHIKKDNLGICGGRQFIAEHFDTTNLKYYIFLEDDMTLADKESRPCRNGFSRYAENLFYKVQKIIEKEGFDFLKFSYTEFFGDNGTQWSWYNVPQPIRDKYFPTYNKLPTIGTDPNAPRTLFKNIKTLENLSYINGEIYYSNWPQIVSRSGNKKMFLDTKWAHPYEQTWMSHMFQLTKDNELKGGLLLLSPIEHIRFEHYTGNLRKES